MPAAPLKKDKAFRRYESNVERALALFDTPQQEWADYISFLGRLLKVILQTQPALRCSLLTPCRPYKPTPRMYPMSPTAPPSQPAWPNV